ncbi:MAG: hypothetical protein J6J16_05115 [Lachnospiraceae bacterium]|nr:hypothetical protein [Lachnospiraceae bacterium]
MSNPKMKKILSAICTLLIFVTGIVVYLNVSPEGEDGGEKDTQTEYDNQENYETYEFRSEDLLDQHFDKHGDEFDYDSVDEYVQGANRVINDPNSLFKIEEEDGDYIYYLESTNEFVVVSTDGYIRTYFKPTDGIDYFNRQ